MARPGCASGSGTTSMKWHSAVEPSGSPFGRARVTRKQFGGPEAAIVRSPVGFPVLFDIAASSYLDRKVASVALHC